MKVLKALLWLSVTPALVYAWLWLGMEGAGNLLAFMVYGLAIMAPLSLTKPAVKSLAENPPAITGTWPIGVACICALVWHGHIAMGVAYAFVMFMGLIARQAAEQARKEAA